MTNVICECCYVVKGWMRSCDCPGGSTRTDPMNQFGISEPWINTTMGRNELSDEARARLRAARTSEGDKP